MPTVNNIDDNNEQLQIDDLISNPPNWLLRSGISMTALVIVCILIMSAFIKYPDKISAKGVMTSEFPPINHVTKIAGIIDSVCVKDREAVEEFQPIAFLKSTAHRPHIYQLQKKLNYLSNLKSANEYRNLHLSKEFRLGDMQAGYAELILKIQELQLLLEETGVQQQINKLLREVIKTKELNKVLFNAKELSNGELDLFEKVYQRKLLLKEEGVISVEELDLATRELFEFKKQYNNLDNGVIQNAIKIDDLNLEAMKLAENKAFKTKNLLLTINESAYTLQQSISKWEDEYVIFAQINGIVTLPTGIANNVPVAEEMNIASVVPINENYDIIAKVVANSNGFGKISIDDKTIIKIAGYPYKEYGTVTAKIGSISPIPNQDEEGEYYYTLEIPLGDTIITNYNKTILYKPNTPLEAEIILNDKSVLERVLNQFLDIIKN